MQQKPHSASSAISLQYNPHIDQAPVITASGTDEMAEAMIKIAQAYQIPIYENPALLNLLAQLEVGEAIPSELYLVIAHILTFVYQLNGKEPLNASN